MNLIEIKHKRLYQIDGVLPLTLFNELASTNWASIEWTRPVKQETWPRRSLDSSVPILKTVTDYIENLQEEIGNLIGVELFYPGTAWWLDEPGFTVAMHTDGHVPAAMQLFWVMPTEDHGTEFYYDYKTLQHKFKSIPNTGYIMLNQLEPDGSQPLQWHSMTNPVPNGTTRVSSYTTFGKYDDK